MPKRKWDMDDFNKAMTVASTVAFGYLAFEVLDKVWNTKIQLPDITGGLEDALKDMEKWTREKSPKVSFIKRGAPFKNPIFDVGQPTPLRDALFPTYGRTVTDVLYQYAEQIQQIQGGSS